MITMTELEASYAQMRIEADAAVDKHSTTPASSDDNIEGTGQVQNKSPESSRDQANVVDVIPVADLETPSFSTLPNELKTKILEYLLDAAKVRDYTDKVDQRFHPNYKFGLSVLRVSNTMQALAKKVFLRNHFVLVSTTYPRLISILEFHRIWFRLSSFSTDGRHSRLVTGL